MYAAQAAVRGGSGAAAVRLDPANGAGTGSGSGEQLTAHHNGEARALAARAIRQSPISPRAVRVLAMANDLDHRPGLQAWRVASAMGWRDPATQFWAMQQALINREYGTAAIRADALLRTSADDKGDRVGAVRGLANSAPFRAELIRRLQLQPRWARPFFAIRSKDPDQEVSGVALTLGDLARSGALAPRDARGAVQALLDRKLFPAAIALDQKVGRNKPAGQPGNLDFASAGDDYVFDVTPFDWNIAEPQGWWFPWNNRKIVASSFWGQMGASITNQFGDMLRSHPATIGSATRCAAPADRRLCSGSRLRVPDLHMLLPAVPPIRLIARISSTGSLRSVSGRIARSLSSRSRRRRLKVRRTRSSPTCRLNRN